jgi:D-aspartate ligase
VSSLLDSRKRPAIVVPGSSVAALGFIRSLGEQGVPVVALADHLGPGLFSKHCKGIICRNLSNPSVLIQTIADVTKAAHERPLVFPASDDMARVLSLNKDAVDRFADVILPDHEITSAALSKRAVDAAAESSGVPHPKSYFPESLEEVAQIGKQINFPCLLKPDYSKEFYRAFGVKAFIPRSADELDRLYRVATSRNLSVFVQEYIPGSTRANYGFAAYFDKDSRPHSLVTYQRLRGWPVDSPGVAAMTISVMENQLVDHAKRFFSSLGFNGIAQAEFIRDSRDDKLKILDVNPRAWSSNRLATRCGCNIPYAGYLDANGLSSEGSTMRAGVKWMNEAIVFPSSLRELRRSRLSLSEFLPSLNGEVVYAIYDRNDARPFAWFLCHEVVRI